MLISKKFSLLPPEYFRLIVNTQSQVALSVENCRCYRARSRINLLMRKSCYDCLRYAGVNVASREREGWAFFYELTTNAQGSSLS